MSPLADYEAPQGEIVIQDLETLKVISDDLRLRLIQILRGQPRTVKDLAGETGVPQKSLYYHVALLEEHGLIRVVRTRIVRGINEKWYQATARLVRLDDAILSAPGAERDEGLTAMVRTALTQTRDDLAARVSAGLLDPAEDTSSDRRLLSTWVLGRLSTEQAEEFYSRLDAVLRDFPVLPRGANPEPDQQTYRLLLAFYPTDAPVSTVDIPKQESGEAET